MASDSDTVMYSTAWCPYCAAARNLLNNKSVSFTEIVISGNAELRDEMQNRSGSTSVPQIFIGERHIGGFDELSALNNSGELDEILRLDSGGADSVKQGQNND